MAATRAAMSRAAGRRNLGTLETALPAHEAGSAGTRSALEDRVLALIGPAGLPEPLSNMPVRAAGRRIEVDLHWPAQGLVVEIDGDGHTRPRTRREDAARDRALRAAGHAVVRFTGGDVDDRPAAVLEACAPRSAGDLDGADHARVDRALVLDGAGLVELGLVALARAEELRAEVRAGLRDGVVV